MYSPKTQLHYGEGIRAKPEKRSPPFKMLTSKNICFVWLMLLHVCKGTEAITFSNFRRGSGVQEGDLRLSGSPRPSEGRVEIYHDGQWGTVCDDGWDMPEAQVVCRQLQFPAAKSVVTAEVYRSGGAPSGPIWMDDMQCTGTEKYLFTCKFKGWGVTDCTHKEDVGVICDTGAEATFESSSYPLDHSIVLSDELGRLFDSGTGCDLLVTALSNTKEQENSTRRQTICAHKLMLSSFPAFNISEDMKTLTVEVVQTCLPYFPSLIRYLYTRKIDVTGSSVQCLHWMASKFGVDQLMRDTGLLFTRILPEDTSFETQVSIYEYAVETGDQVLQENCARYLAWNFQNFTQTPTWTQISFKLLSALLRRSDLVVPEEWFVLTAVENWILNNNNTTTSDTQVTLLSLIRLPMIPAEQLSLLEKSSSVYSTHQNLLRDNMLKAFQFNIQLLTNLKSQTRFVTDDDSFQPRIYTSDLWSVSFGPFSHTSQSSYNSYYQPRSMSISVPYHSSMIFNDKKINWVADIFLNHHECSNRGTRCLSLPMARLTSYESLRQAGIVFHNRLLLKCQKRYICQVQDFKSDQAYVSKNDTYSFPYPCPDDQYQFLFVVRPEYI